MTHAIVNELSPPYRPVAPNEELTIIFCGVGRSQSGHGFGLIVFPSASPNNPLCEYSYVSPKFQTTFQRGDWGALISSLEWREKYAQGRPLTIKSSLEQVYGHFPTQGQKWCDTYKKKGEWNIKNGDLFEKAWNLWHQTNPKAVIERVTTKTDKDIQEAAKDLGRAIWHDKLATAGWKPGDPIEDMQDYPEASEQLAKRAYDRDRT